ncbi:MAG TPA: bacteriohopanetetrol glucosamine biosynthesis glycosyltransferase HpnI [Rhizomicrobium sp.]|nr:bacteriohopanetetrol glucosamine biosynthesis glycosyltransferase HpnI [Rhizomicrobium sp.]
MHWLHLIGDFAAVLGLFGAIYALIASAAAARALKSPAAEPTSFPSVTLLKPLHSDEPMLAENLESFFAQDYPAPVQIVFGVQNAADPAIPVVRKLQARHPDLDMDLVIDARLFGANRKISNLINMMPRARHDVLILSDSDIAVPPHWLQTVIGTLQQPGVGAVTCLYIGKPLGSLWSKLAAMGISYQFLPNVVVGTQASLAAPCFGSTIAFTRQTLEEIGGFQAFSGFLADDYEIGRAIREKGYSLALPHIVVDHICSERSFGELIRHELRWNRTIRSINPTGHAGSGAIHALPLAFLATLLLGFNALSLFVLATALLARAVLKWRIDRLVGTKAGPIWLLPLRDAISFFVFLGSLFGSSIHWRGQRFDIQASGGFSQSEVS